MMISKHNNSAKQRGYTLLELMIAMSLGLFLVAGIIMVYIENKKNYVQDEELARIQEGGRYALNVLKHEIQMAGFYGGIESFKFDLLPETSFAAGDGCTADKKWAKNLKMPMDYADEISAAGSVTTGNGFDLGCTGSMTTGSDLIALKRTADSPSLINGAYPTAADNWPAGQVEIPNWSYLVLPTGDLDPPLAGVSFAALGAGGFTAAMKTASTDTMWQFFSRIFYVRNFSVTGDGIPTLVVEDLKGSGEGFSASSVLQGVEEMQIEYGIAGTDVLTTFDTRPVRYESAPSADEWERVSVVRVYLLVRSLREMPEYVNVKKYNLGAKAIAAKNDGYIRRVFTTTVKLRNAALIAR